MQIKNKKIKVVVRIHHSPLHSRSCIFVAAARILKSISGTDQVQLAEYSDDISRVSVILLQQAERLTHHHNCMLNVIRIFLWRNICYHSSDASLHFLCNSRMLLIDNQFLSVQFAKHRGGGALIIRSHTDDADKEAL